MERVSVDRNIVYAGAIPFICLIIWLFATKATLHKFHVTILGFLIRWGGILNFSEKATNIC